MRFVASNFTVLLFFALNCYASHVAVLETIGASKALSRDERLVLTDMLRQVAVETLPSYMGYTIMTRDNISAMLPPGKSVEDCEGSCLVETGKNISADYIAQARVTRFGKTLCVTVELYETATSKLLSSFVGKGKRAENLLNEIEKRAPTLFSAVKEAQFPLGGGVSSQEIGVNGAGVVLDKAGNRYKTVKIGEQIWMAENLNLKTENSWCYENEEKNCEKYGRLYKWSAAVGRPEGDCGYGKICGLKGVVQGVCPDGWHLPSMAEFKKMISVIGGDSVAGEMLKSKIGWTRDGNGKDAYGFSALPAGLMGGKYFDYEGEYANFWTSSEYEEEFEGQFAYYIGLHDDYKAIYDADDALGKFYAISVRCVKN